MTDILLILFEAFDILINGEILTNFELISGDILEVSFLVDSQEFKLRVRMAYMRFMLNGNFQEAINKFFLWYFLESIANFLIEYFDQLKYFIKSIRLHINSDSIPFALDIFVDNIINDSVFTVDVVSYCYFVLEYFVVETLFYLLWLLTNFLFLQYRLINFY